MSHMCLPSERHILHVRGLTHCCLYCVKSFLFCHPLLIKALQNKFSPVRLWVQDKQSIHFQNQTYKVVFWHKHSQFEKKCRITLSRKLNWDYWVGVGLKFDPFFKLFKSLKNGYNLFQSLTQIVWFLSRGVLHWFQEFAKCSYLLFQLSRSDRQRAKKTLPRFNLSKSDA